MNRNDNDISGANRSRFSDEDRARIAQENAGARREMKRRYEEIKAVREKSEENTSSRRDREETKTAADSVKKKKSSVQKKSAGKTASKSKTASIAQSGSRNDRVKDSQQERKKHNKRNTNLIIAMFFIVALSFIVIFAAFALKVNTIEIEGTERYSDKSVTEAADFNRQISMILFNAEHTENKIETALPYIENAEIKRVWPDKLLVTLEDAVPALAVDTGKGYILMNRSLKVLDDDAVTIGEDAALIRGVSVASSVPGKIVEFADEISLEEFISLISSFEEFGIENITEYNLTLLSDVTVVLEHRVEVKLGTLVGSAKKLGFARYVIEETVNSDKKHPIIIDFTADGKAYARIKNDSNVSFEEPETEAPETESTTAAEESSVPQDDNGFSVG